MLHPGDRLTLVRKSMGRKAGEPLVCIANVEVVYDPMLLVLEGDQAYAVQDLVKDAVNAALTAVHRADNGGLP
jgi:hypothetical protein